MLIQIGISGYGRVGKGAGNVSQNDERAGIPSLTEARLSMCGLRDDGDLENDGALTVLFCLSLFPQVRSLAMKNYYCRSIRSEKWEIWLIN